MKESDKNSASLILKYVSEMINASSPPPIPAEWAKDEEAVILHERLMEIRLIISEFARGNLSRAIQARGFMAGGFKALQSNLRHLTWQAQQVEQGDFSQQVQFLGDFSAAFNNMVMQLDKTINELKENEEKLTLMTESLQKEIDLRTAAAHALKTSEARFKYLAEHDALTHVSNRRSFLAMALSELGSAHESKINCCIAMLDVDHFKLFNDTYGHTDGDIALQHVVSVTQKHLRQSDILGRYGGEEFILFFANADLTQGMAAAERIRQAIENSPVRLSRGDDIPISASIGVTVVKPEWYSAEEIDKQLQFYISHADSALYRAKQEGRNTVRGASVMAPDLSQEIPDALTILAGEVP